MFDPKYSITNKILSNIKKITKITLELNNKHFSKLILTKLIKEAQEISTYASTSIEGNPLPLTDVKKVLKNQEKNIRDTEKEVINYNKALIWLDKNYKTNFNAKLILEIHKTVTTKLLPNFKSGKLRQEPVFVNDPSQKKPIYWPPDHQDIKKLNQDLFDYINKNNKIIDPLILAGIFHKQFVIIHPFIDGNGRTVRLATKLLLSKMGLNTFNLFSFENYYNKNVSKYFQNVGVTGNYYDIQKNINFTPWLEYFTDGIIDELLRVSKTLEEKSISPKTIIKEHHKIIIKYIKKHGFINNEIYSKLTTRAKATRNQDFNQLIKMKIIERIGKGKASIYKLFNQ